MKSILCGVLILLSSLACTNAETASSEQTTTAAQSQEAVVAEVGGRRITLKDLDDRWQSVDPAERARVTQLLYQNRRNVLELMVGDLLIEEAAKGAGLAKDEFQKKEVAARLKPITDDDIKQFYEENKERAQGRPIDQLTAPIREYLTGQRQQQARAQLVDDLKKKSSARVMLDPPRQTVNVSADDPSSGPASAPITVVEFSDYQCPFCARVGPDADEDCARPTATRFASCSRTSRCRIMPRRRRPPRRRIAPASRASTGTCTIGCLRISARSACPRSSRRRRALGLDAAKFDQCLDSGKYAAGIAEDMKQGESLGVQSTPTVYVNGRPVVGAQPYEFFQMVIDEELAQEVAATVYERQHDLSVGGRLENALVRLRRVAERQLHRHVRRQRAVVEARVERAIDLRPLVGRRVPQRHPDDGALLRHRLARIDLDAATIADDDDPAAEGERGEIVVEIHVGEVLEDDVGAASVGQLLQPIEVVRSRDD